MAPWPEDLTCFAPAEAPDAHGTGIAGAISARARLLGVAPAARILAVRAFGGGKAESTTFNVMTGIDWASTNGARVLNMSFAGPRDPLMGRELAAAHRKGIVLVAASGNAGPNSPPLYPAAEPAVIAVTATDAEDNVFAASNRGSHIGVAAPGTNILHAAPYATYRMSSGTSLAAAHVSGIVALLLERQPDLTPDWFATSSSQPRLTWAQRPRRPVRRRPGRRLSCSVGHPAKCRWCCSNKAIGRATSARAGWFILRARHPHARAMLASAI